MMATGHCQICGYTLGPDDNLYLCGSHANTNTLRVRYGLKDEDLTLTVILSRFLMAVFCYLLISMLGTTTVIISIKYAIYLWNAL